MVTAEMIFIGLLQAIGLLALAPLFSGFSRVLRAKMHNRRGPSILQNYRDLAKLMKRQEVVSSQAGWVFRITPFVTLAAMLLAATIVPMFTVQSPFGWAGDLILVIYLYALWRFFFAVSGLETGSTLGGIGAKRELIMSVLIEPVILLVLFVMALLAGSTNLGTISTKVASGQTPYYTSVWLGMLAFAFATLVEMSKLPFDLGEAEQELQEGPLAEFSGRSLALMKWGIYLKQVVLVALFLASPPRPARGWFDLSALRGEWKVMAAGLCGVTLYFLAQNVALSYTLAANVSVLVSVAPLFTALLA